MDAFLNKLHRTNERNAPLARIKMLCGCSNCENWPTFIENWDVSHVWERNKHHQIKKFVKKTQISPENDWHFTSNKHSKNVWCTWYNLYANLIKLNANYNKLFSAFRIGVRRPSFVLFQCACILHVCLFVSVMTLFVN